MADKRVWNAIPFSDELDLLECRLAELYDHVHRFVIAESELTYSGHPKPLYYAENEARYGQWKDKIIHVIADTSEAGSSPEREWRQRQALWRGMDAYDPGDILITTDADEIPHADELHYPGLKIMNRHHPLAVNLFDSVPWGGYVAHTGAKRPDMMELRQRLHSRLIRTRMGRGWHFSWLGGPEQMRKKVQTLLEYEMIPRVVRSAEDYYYNRINPGPTGARELEIMDIDQTFPRYIQERKGPAWWYWPGPQDIADAA